MQVKTSRPLEDKAVHRLLRTCKFLLSTATSHIVFPYCSNFTPVFSTTPPLCFPKPITVLSVLSPCNTHQSYQLSMPSNQLAPNQSAKAIRKHKPQEAAGKPPTREVLSSTATFPSLKLSSAMHYHKT